VFTTIVTDKAYGRTAHLQPIFTEAGLHLIGPQQLAICIKIDKCNHKLRLSVEKSFNHQDTKFKHCDHIQSKKIVRDGQSNRPYLRRLWDLHVFFFNLFTCAHTCGNQAIRAIGVLPPSLAKYLYSANHGLLVPLPNEYDKDKEGVKIRFLFLLLSSIIKIIIFKINNLCQLTK